MFFNNFFVSQTDETQDLQGPNKYNMNENYQILFEG